MDHDLLLVRYGEIGLKSRSVRRRFEAQLKDNIEYAFEQEGLDAVVKRIPGRFLVHTSDLLRGGGILTRVFGITSLSPARRYGSDLDELEARAVEYTRAWRQERPDASTFAVRSRRSGNHDYTSQDVARRLGAAVLQDSEAGVGLTVDLDEADFELHVDVRGNQAYVFSHVERGPSGLPLGTAGRVLVLLKDRNSLAAAWLMMKRGCTVIPVHFEGPTGRKGRAEAFELVLKRWYLRGHLRELDHAEAEGFPADDACALCFRQMLRKATHAARRKRAKTIVTGETLASTTAPLMNLTAEATDLTVLRPLMGLMPSMVEDVLRRAGAPEPGESGNQEPCPLRTQAIPVRERVLEHEGRLGLDEAALHAVAGDDA